MQLGLVVLALVTLSSMSSSLTEEGLPRARRHRRGEHTHSSHGG